MAEALLRHHGGDAFEVHSAGTEPRGVNPLTLAGPRRSGHRPSGRARSRWGVPRPAVRLRDHRLRRGPRRLPGLPGRLRVAPLGLRGSGRGDRHGRGATRRVRPRAHRGLRTHPQVHPARSRAGTGVTEPRRRRPGARSSSTSTARPAPGSTAESASPSKPASNFEAPDQFDLRSVRGAGGKHERA